MSKEELLDILSAYALSNSGKEKMEYKTLKTYVIKICETNFIHVFNYLAHYILP